MATPQSITPAVVPMLRKSVARVALIDLTEPAQSLLSECFHQFGMETIPLTRDHADRLRKEKFEACVLPLGPAAGSVIELARESASNSRMVIYGLGGTAQDSLRYSKFCLNAVFHEPLERSAVVKLVRSTQTLVLHEFRRYARVPVMTEVAVELGDGGRLTATSKEISTGGMSLKGNYAPEPGSGVQVSFSLLTLPRLKVRGNVAWRSSHTFGIRFDSADTRRNRLKEWLVAYLDS